MFVLLTTLSLLNFVYLNYIFEYILINLLVPLINNIYKLYNVKRVIEINVFTETIIEDDPIIPEKDLLEKNFKQDIDYKCLLNQQVKQKSGGRGGHNKEKIMLNIKTFKLLWLKAGTTKAGQIHEYYLKLEETLQEVIEEENE